MRNLAEEDGYGVIGEPVDLGPILNQTGFTAPDTPLKPVQAGWSFWQWALCIGALLMVLSLGIAAMLALRVLPMVAGAR